MRTDFKMDNCRVHLPNASTLGFGRFYAKRGNWITTDAGFTGRVLGRVTCQRKVYIYAVGFQPGWDCVATRWVSPKDVNICLEEFPKDILKLAMMGWKDVDQIIGELNPLLSDPLVKGDLT